MIGNGDLELEFRFTVRQHADDVDGGYGLVTDLVRLADRLDSVERDRFGALLLQLVTRRDALWGVALEALVQAHVVKAAPSLDRLLSRSKRADEFQRQLILALARMGYKPGVHRYARYVRDRLRGGDLAALPVLAALSHIDGSLSVELASDFFSRALTDNERAPQIINNIPAFVHNFCDTEPTLLESLVARTRSQSPEAASRLARTIVEVLDRPRSSNALGSSLVAELKQNVAKAAS